MCITLHRIIVIMSLEVQEETARENTSWIIIN